MGWILTSLALQEEEENQIDPGRARKKKCVTCRLFKNQFPKPPLNEKNVSRRQQYIKRSIKKRPSKKLKHTHKASPSFPFFFHYYIGPPTKSTGAELRRRRRERRARVIARFRPLFQDDGDDGRNDPPTSNIHFFSPLSK